MAVDYMFSLHSLESVSKVLPYGVYTIPELSIVDLTEEAAKERQIEYCVGKSYVEHMARGKILGAK